MQEAIAFTWDTLTARLRNLRIGSFLCLVFAVFLAILAMVKPSWWILAGIPVILFSGFYFLYRDQKLVFTWEEHILDQWTQPGFVMGIFVQAMGNHPHALKKSLKSLVSTLPADPDFQDPAPERVRLVKRLFWTRKAIQETRLFRAVARNILLATLPLLFVFAKTMDWPLRLMFMAPVLIYPALEYEIGRLVFGNWRNRMVTLGKMGPEESGEFAVGMEKLDWNRIPEKLRRRFGKHVTGPTR